MSSTRLSQSLDGLCDCTIALLYHNSNRSFTTERKWTSSRFLLISNLTIELVIT